MSRTKEIFCAIAVLILSYLLGYMLVGLLIFNDATAIPTVPVTNPQNKKLTGLVGQPFNFSLMDEQSKPREFIKVQNHRPTFVYFFAYGCPHCAAMLTSMREYVPHLQARGFQIAGISYYGTPASCQAAQNQYNLPSPVFADSAAAVCQQHGVGEFTIMLIDRNNIIRYRTLMPSAQSIIWPDDGMLDQILQIQLSNNTDNIATTNRADNTPVADDNSLDLDKNSPVVTSINNIPVQNGNSLPAQNNGNNLASPKQNDNLAQGNNLAQRDNLKSQNSLLPGCLAGRYLEIPKPQQTTVFYLLGLLILAGLIIGCSFSQGSWLPVLAATELALIGWSANVWQYWPVNILLLITIGLLLIQRKWILVPAFLCGVTIFVLLMLAFTGLPKATAMGAEIAAWRMAPQIFFSCLLFALAFVETHTKQVYEKTAYYGMPQENMAAHEGALAIKGVSKAERCDICHQNDMFNTDTGFCTRCQRHTV